MGLEPTTSWTTTRGYHQLSYGHRGDPQGYRDVRPWARDEHIGATRQFNVLIGGGAAGILAAPRAWRNW